MSMERTDYVIVGYDLTAHRDKIMTDKFRDSEEYERFTCYQKKGEIQLFTDPSSGDYLYLGYVVSVNDEYNNSTNVETLHGLEEQHQYVANKLNQLFDKLYVEDNLNLHYELLCFSEWI